MLKEGSEITEAIIQLIQSLPETQQKKIAKTLTARKKASSNRPKTSYRVRAKELIADMKKTRGRLPKNYQFDREEANER